MLVKSFGVIHNAKSKHLLCDFEQVNYKHNEEYCRAFGVHLRKLRLEKGFGMREFALLADMEYSQLSKIERGVTNPTISTVLALADTLEMPHTELLNFRFPIKKEKQNK